MLTAGFSLCWPRFAHVGMDLTEEFGRGKSYVMAQVRKMPLQFPVCTHCYAKKRRKPRVEVGPKPHPLKCSLNPSWQTEQATDMLITSGRCLHLIDTYIKPSLPLRVRSVHASVNGKFYGILQHPFSWIFLTGERKRRSVHDLLEGDA